MCDKKNKDYYTPGFLLVAVLSVVAMSFAPEIVRIFAGSNYVDAVYVIPPIACSVYFIYLYSMFCMIEYYYQRTTFIAITTCISAGMNIILNYVAIPWFGYYAAGYTTLASYICLACMHYFAYKRIMREQLSDINSLYDIQQIACISVVLLAVMFAMIYTYSIVLLRYGIILFGGALLVWKRKYFV